MFSAPGARQCHVCDPDSLNRGNRTRRPRGAQEHKAPRTEGQAVVAVLVNRVGECQVVARLDILVGKPAAFVQCFPYDCPEPALIK